ncbi:MAG: site-specific integrase [Pyrinomonadaceae bacterium]|nr:site-specific integrase [Pyrinomonadaceae bacterium]
MALYKRPNSKFWWMKFTFDSQLIQKSTNVANKRDALTIESAYRTQLALGKIGINTLQKAPTFDKAVDDFLQWSTVKHNNKSTTHNRYYFNCQVLKKYFGKTKVNLIKTKDIENFIVWRSKQTSRKTKEPITRETVNHEVLVLKMIFKRLVQNDFLRINPCTSIKRLPKNERQFHVITESEQKQYLLACPQPLKDVASLMIQTGMRCDEVYRIRRDEIFLDKNFLKITKGKTKASIRKIHLSEKAKSILEYRLNKFEGEFLFPQDDVDGQPATKTLDYFHRKTVKKLKLNFRLYDCRHTFATRAVEKGIDLLTLSSILGHSGLDMITRYSHPSEERKADAIKQMERMERKLQAKAV